MKRLGLVVVLLIFLQVAGCGSAPSPANGPSAVAKAYLSTALDYIKHYSVMSKNVDWTTERQNAFALAQHARTTRDTYLVIKLVLEDLADHHSHFFDPQEAKLAEQGMTRGLGLIATYPERIVVQVFSGSSADRAGVRVRDTLETINGVPARTLGSADVSTALSAESAALTLKHQDQAQTISVTLHAGTYDHNPLPRGQALANRFGYLEVPEFGTAERAVNDGYSTRLQQLIERVDRSAPCGWILDLRRNRGGSSWAMLAGVGPLLGEGKVGSFVDANGQQTPWFYRNGQALQGQVVIDQVNTAYHLKRTMPPVAVLTSQYTASAGEALVVAFRGRAHTSSFGEATAGVPTANMSRVLSDGAVLVLTEAFDADRTGRVYSSPLLSDHYVETNWSQLDTNKDPVLQSASTWLASLRECRK